MAVRDLIEQLESLNPRWVACQVATGREPEPWEFIIWINQRWAEFFARYPECPNEKEHLVSHGVSETHREFDAWLQARFPLIDQPELAQGVLL